MRVGLILTIILITLLAAIVIRWLTMENRPRACDFQIPKGYCLLYNDNTKKYIVSQMYVRHREQYSMVTFINNKLVEKTYPAREDTGYLYIANPFKFEDDASYLYKFGGDYNHRVLFEDSCLAKGALKYIIDVANQVVRDGIVRDSLNKIKAKQDSINNAFKPINCKQ